MYSVLDYGLMASDGVRMSAYARAIERAVRPGSVVLDLGSGTGIFALLAARQGARHVYAVDENPAAWLARDLAAENGFAGRISVFEASSFDVELPEKVDVIVSDMRGKTSLKGDHLAAVRDARTRWLAPGGVSIPRRDRLFVGVVEAEDIARDLASGWESCGDLGFAVEAIRRSILNSVHDDRRRPLPASAMLTTAESWATVDYAGDAERVFGTPVELVATRRGIAHGLAVWFEATLMDASQGSGPHHDAISYSSMPGQELAYARGFLPFLEPVRLTEGDRANVTLQADARGARWSWETSFCDAGGAAKASFRQATFLGMPTSPHALLRGSITAHPRISERGARLRRVLEAMDGLRTPRDIVETLRGETSPTDPLHARLEDEVRDAIERYAR